MAAPARHWRFSVDDYAQMTESGIFTEDDRVELIEGEIYEMSPIGGPHVECVNRLTWIITRAAPSGVLVSVQNPVRIGDLSLPEPDLAVLRDRPFDGKVPVAGDVLLLIEVSDTTMRYDRDVKVPLYAQAGIPEVWITDISRRVVIRYRAPVDGEYREIRTYAQGETLTPACVPEITITVDDIFNLS